MSNDCTIRNAFLGKTDKNRQNSLGKTDKKPYICLGKTD
jgi:hypothetical protein